MHKHRRRLIELAHRVITYGEPPEYRARIMGEWEQHLQAATEEGDPPSELMHSIASYIRARIADGPKTLIPAGVLCFLGAVGASSVAASGVSPDVPLWAHLFLAVALLLNAFVLLHSPRSPHPNSLRFSLLLLAIAGIVGAIEIEPTVSADYLLIAGWSLISLGAFTFSIASATRLAAPQRFAVWFISFGFFSVGIANASWTNLTSSIQAATICAVTGTLALAGAWSLLRLQDTIGHLPTSKIR